MIKKLASAVLSLGLLTGLAACQPQDPIEFNYSAEDNRELYKRSADIAGLTFTVDSYSINFSEYNGRRPSGRGYFLQIEYTLENESTVPRGFSVENISVVVDEGDEFPLEQYGVTDIMGVNTTVSGLMPNQTYTGTLMFELPAGVIPDFLLLKEINGDRVKVIDIPDIEENQANAKN